MSEPCSFTALIRLTPEAFAALMRSKTLDPLADAVVRIVTDGLNDIVVFKYLKKDQALFAHRYFHYPEPLESLLEEPGVAAILAAASAFKDTDIADRAIVSHDANNFARSAPSAGFLIEQGRSGRKDDFDAETLDGFDRLIGKHFFGLVAGFGDGGSHWFKNARVLDPKLRRKVERRLDARQLLIARERVPAATPLRPVRLFDKYHHNGHFVIWSGRSPIRPLIGIDPQTLRQTAYGAADTGHIVVDGVVRRTDPARFRMLRKDDTVFYVDAEGVYDAGMEPVPDADPGTFKLVHAAYARDGHRWYTHRGAPLADVGAGARIDDSLYYLTLTLLLGERSAYLGDRRLPVDAASCKVVRTKPLRRDPFYGGLLWLADGQGDCIVSCVGRFGQAPSLDVRRSSTPEAGWAEQEAAWESLAEAASPIETLRRETRRAKEGEDAAHGFVGFFEDWLSRHFEDHWRADPYDGFVWEGVERYFEVLGRSGGHERLLAFYARIEAEAWYWPQIFLHTVPACLALGRIERGVEELRRAVIYSYFAAGKLFETPRIAALAEREDVAHMKAFADYVDSRPGKRPPLPGELARHFLGAIPDRHKVKAVQRIFNHFHIPGAAFLRSMRAGDAENAALYEQSLSGFVNACMLSEATRGVAAYDARKNYPAWDDLPALHPAVHLIAASSLYAEGFFWNDMKGADEPRREFEHAAVALGRAKAAAAEPRWSGDPDWQAFASDPVYAPLLSLHNHDRFDA